MHQPTLRLLPFVLSSLIALTSARADDKPPSDPEAMTRPQVTDIIASIRKITSPNGVEERVAVPINGATQWITVRGRDRNNPILLYLHGGPGSPTMPAAWTFEAPWEDYFTVVQWDQRGAGKTYAANDPQTQASMMTIEQMTRDAEALVQYLQGHYGKKKIFVLGHSWGSALGLTLVQRHPEWLYAYIGVGQMINARRSEAEGYQWVLSEARSHQNTDALREMTALAPYPGDGPISIDRIAVDRKWIQFYGGLTFGRADFSYDANSWMLSPDYSLKELDAIDDGSSFSLSHLLPTLTDLNFDKVDHIGCPVFMFLGRHDYTTSYTVAQQWFAQLHAPIKKLVTFENSAHMVPQEEPGRFLFHLITDVRPIAVKAGDGPAN